jgi:GNAT superfamily N-acetyltransferase
LTRSLPTWSAAEYGRRLDAQRRGTLVQFAAWEGGVPIGKGHLLLPGHEQWSISAHRCGCTEARDVQVVPDHRRRGVATALMLALEAATRERGMNRIGLTVAQDDDAAPARALYERLGYRFAHGPFVSSVTIPGDDGPIHFATVLTYLAKEL